MITDTLCNGKPRSTVVSWELLQCYDQPSVTVGQPCARYQTPSQNFIDNLLYRWDVASI